MMTYFGQFRQEYEKLVQIYWKQNGVCMSEQAFISDQDQPYDQ